MNQPLQTLAKLAETVGVDYSAINSDDMIIQTAEAALKEIKRLTTELSKETVRKEAAYANEQRLDNDNLELRRRIFARFNEDECWIFQDDGHDYPESLVCPVVMSAGKLRELVEARSELDEMAARVERFREIVVSYYTTGVCVSDVKNILAETPPPAALEALKSQWQADQYNDGMPAQKAFWEGFERGVMNGAVNIRAHWNEYKQRVQEAGDEV
ncbi:MAG: hypothetical protein COB09_08345 [Thalassobium sp.]|nr:MAG: hypothetical protein COB09_08345 [Thalassobium sp.]